MSEEVQRIKHFVIAGDGAFLRKRTPALIRERVGVFGIIEDIVLRRVLVDFGFGHGSPQENFLTIVQGAAGDVVCEPFNPLLISRFNFYILMHAEPRVNNEIVLDYLRENDIHFLQIMHEYDHKYGDPKNLLGNKLFNRELGFKELKKRAQDTFSPNYSRQLHCHE